MLVFARVREGQNASVLKCVEFEENKETDLHNAQRKWRQVTSRRINSSSVPSSMRVL